MHYTVSAISYNTHDDTESFAKVIASFKPSDVKPLASIRYRTLWRNDAVKVLESVMAKSPKLITGDLPRWLANHLFDQNSYDYTRYEVAREQAFQYLTSFATEVFSMMLCPLSRQMNTTKWILMFIVATPRIPFPKIFTTNSNVSWHL